MKVGENVKKEEFYIEEDSEFLQFSVSNMNRSKSLIDLSNI